MNHQIKLQRAIKQANVFKGQTTLSAIKDQLPESLLETLTAKDIALVLEVINKAYHTGRASTGAEMIDTNAVYIQNIGKVIEWSEVGAEYKQVPFEEVGISGFRSTGTRPEKVKDGVLVPKFSD
jgi:hypothetical protein